MFTLYAFMSAGHKSSLLVSANPLDSFTSDMYYGVGIPSDWLTTKDRRAHV